MNGWSYASPDSAMEDAEFCSTLLELAKQVRRQNHNTYSNVPSVASEETEP